MDSTRRLFLKWLAGAGALATAAATLVPSLRAFGSPLRAQRRPLTWVRLGEAAEFDLEIPIKVDFIQQVDDAWVERRILHSVWVHTEDGDTFTVFNGRCPHLGCGFAFDETKKEFNCPCHHGRFEVKTGAVKGGPPPRGLDTLPVKIERGILYTAFQDFRSGVPEKIAQG